MRRLIFLVAVSLAAACGGRASHGPAWPTRADPETDGGESLAPRTATSVEAAGADDTDDEAVATADVAATTGDTPAEASSSTTTPSTPATVEDVIFTEEITIEIEDDD